MGKIIVFSLRLSYDQVIDLAMISMFWLRIQGIISLGLVQRMPDLHAVTRFVGLVMRAAE